MFHKKYGRLFLLSLCLIWLDALPAYASAKVINDITFNTEANGEINAAIKFTIPIEYRRYFPHGKSTLTSIYFDIPRSVPAAEWRNYETHKSSPSELVQDITVSTRDRNTGPKVIINLHRPAVLTVSVGSNKKLLLIHIKPDTSNNNEDKQPPSPVSGTAVSIGMLSASAELPSSPAEGVPSATSDSSTIAASPASATPNAPLLVPSLDEAGESAIASAQHFVITTEIGISAMRFMYEETDLGVLQDKESGNIPGVSLKLGLRHANWEWETAGSYQQGQVSYFMPSGAGGPYNARTNETIGDASLRLGYWLGEQQSFMPFVGIGYHRWDRNILPGTMSGLFESYQWKYAWIGSKWMAYQDGPSNLIFDVGLLRPLSPKMKADYRAIYNDEPVFYLNGETGLRMMLTYNFAISQHVGLRMEPYYENWKLGQSQTIPEGIYTLHEPSSTTQNIGLNLRLGWAM